MEKNYSSPLLFLVHPLQNVSDHLPNYEFISVGDRHVSRPLKAPELGVEVGLLLERQS